MNGKYRLLLCQNDLTFDPDPQAQLNKLVALAYKTIDAYMQALPHANPYNDTPPVVIGDDEGPPL